MRAPYQYLLPLLSLFLTRVDLTDIYPLVIPVRLVKILDGDTVHVKNGSRLFKVRLSKIDSPEKGQPFVGRPFSDAGEASKICFEKVLHGRQEFGLRLNGFDIYGRILGDLDHVSLELVQSGCAGLYPYANFDSRMEKRIFLATLFQARERRRGLWRDGGYQQPKTWRKRSGLRFRRQISHHQSHQ